MGRATDDQPAQTSESSFANTSREARSKQPIPAHLVETAATVGNRRSSTPVRTQSIFREDLPETATTPRSSRVASPDVPVIPETAPATTAPSTKRQPNPTTGSPLTGVAAIRGRTDSPVEFESRSSAVAPLSTSLASVDSEGSWLTGRPSQRKSNQSQLHNSIGSLMKRNEDFSGSYEDLGMPEDEFFRRLTPSVETPGGGTAAVVSVAPTVVEEDDDAELIRRDTNRRRPTLVQRDPRVKSREGLLSDYHAGEVATPMEEEEQDHIQEQGQGRVSADSTEENSPETDQFFHQAVIEYGRGHARQLSSGSAKLLDIPPSRNRSGRNSPDTRGSLVVADVPTSPVMPSPRL